MIQKLRSRRAHVALRAVLLTVALGAVAGAADAQHAVDLPPSLQGHVEVLKLQDPDYERAAA